VEGTLAQHEPDLAEQLPRSDLPSSHRIVWSSIDPGRHTILFLLAPARSRA
jgi:hypothetical protein